MALHPDQRVSASRLTGSGALPPAPFLFMLQLSLVLFLEEDTEET